MKVLQINAVYGHGSTGTIVRDIEQLCLESGIECYVASPDKAVLKAKNGYVIGNTFDHKLHAVLCRINGKQAYFSHLATRRFLNFIDKIQPDIVHLHNLHSNYINLNMLLKYLAKKDIRTIVTLHDCWFFTGGCFHYTADGCKGWLKKCGECPSGKCDPISYFGKRTAKILDDRKRFLCAIPHLVVTGVSDWISNEARKTFLRDFPIVTIRNGIDLQVFKPTKSDFRHRLNLEGKYVILGPASKWLLPINKQVLLGFTKMMQPDEVLLLFGVTSETQRNYIDSINLGNRVLTYGFTRNCHELAEIYTMADVFVNVSREDSLSLINIEAQACGTPVVTFDETGPSETVDGINSLRVKTGDVLNLYESAELIRKSRTDSESLHKFVSLQFAVNSLYHQYIDLYNKVSSR